MEEYLSKIKEIEIDMLKHFLAICEKHNLRYFLINGSCLGAVKYGGFIPWDDDIDIGMFRNDYEKFLEVAQKELPENIFLQTAQTDKEYLCGFAKLRNSQTTFIEKSSSKLNINHGVYIDIFPLDGYRKSFITNFKMKIFKNIIGTEYVLKNYTFKRKVFERFRKLFNVNPKKLTYKLEKIAKKYATENAKYIRSFFGAWEEKEIHKKDVFGVGAEADFEGIKVTIPSKYDEYLTKTYGNYKEDIADEEKKTHHITKIIDLKNPYTKYLRPEENLDRNKLKEIQIDIFKEFIKICNKYELKYFLMGGSCLGAIRHRGFIPWDDDIDVALFREDYERFLEVAPKELPENIFLQHLGSENEYYNGFAKLRNSNTTFIEKSVANHNINHGVFVDVFPLDGYKESAIRYNYIKILKIIVGLAFSSENTSGKRKFLFLFKKIFGINLKKAAFKLREAAKKYSYKDTEYFHSYYGAWDRKEIMPKYILGEGAQGSFEGITVTLPEKYDEYLTRLYGDYMTPPPPEKQVSHHYCDIIDLDRSYKEYVSEDGVIIF